MAFLLLEREQNQNSAVNTIPKGYSNNKEALSVTIKNNEYSVFTNFHGTHSLRFGIIFVKTQGN